jgi:acyl dehydratase
VITIADLMPVETKAVGKEWEPATFEVEGARISRYADAVGEDSDVYRDPDAAKAAGFRGQVAPPMFAVAYSAPAMGPAILDPDVGINFPAMVHGGQEFEWGEPVVAGDVITTAARCVEIYEKDGKGFYVFETVSTNQDGAETVRAKWTNIVRGV